MKKYLFLLFFFPGTTFAVFSPNPKNPDSTYQNDLALHQENRKLYRGISPSTGIYCIDSPTLCIDVINNRVLVGTTTTTSGGLILAPSDNIISLKMYGTGNEGTGLQFFRGTINSGIPLSYIGDSGMWLSNTSSDVVVGLYPSRAFNIYYNGGNTSAFGIDGVSGAVRIRGTSTNDTPNSSDVGFQYSTGTTSKTNSGSNGVFTNLISTGVGAGSYSCSAQLCQDVGGGVTTAGFQIAISSFSGNTTTDHIGGQNVLSALPATTGIDSCIPISNYQINLFNLTTMYLKSNDFFTVGTPTFYGYLSCLKTR